MNSSHEPRLEFQFKGAEGRAAAEELAEFLQSDFADWTPSVQEQTPPPIGHKDVDPMAMWTLIITIPGTLLAAWEIAERVKAKTRVDRVILWSRERAARGHEVPVLHLPDGRAMPLHQATSSDFLDAIEAASKQTRW